MLKTHCKCRKTTSRSLSFGQIRQQAQQSTNFNLNLKREILKNCISRFFHIFQRENHISNNITISYKISKTASSSDDAVFVCSYAFILFCFNFFGAAPCRIEIMVLAAELNCFVCSYADIIIFLCRKLCNRF